VDQKAGVGLWHGRRLVEEHFFYGLPVVYAAVVGYVDVGGGGVEDAFAVEDFELADVVIDEVVGAEDGFVAAEDDVGGGDEGEVLGQPLEFGGEAGGDFHGGGGDEDVVAGLEAVEDAGGIGHDGKVAEEVLVAEVGVERGVAGGRNDLPEAAAAEVGEGEGLGEVVGEVAVVAEKVFAEGVGDNFVHVDGDDFAVVIEERHAGVVLLSAGGRG
jgi:hypothetical protein